MRGSTMLLEGKKAIITGGTRGIGYAIACRFIEEGLSLIHISEPTRH